MELFVTTTSILSLITLISLPIILRRHFAFPLLLYWTIALIFGGIIIVTLAWWSNYSDLLLLEHYGYNIDGMNDIEFYGNVSKENLEKVKKLETNIMGIGWPLKAIFSIPIYILYILFVVSIFKPKNNKKVLRTN